jgi:hypothetical protein
MDNEIPSPGDSCCKALADFAVVPMGGIGLDRLVFSSFGEPLRHGGDQWWLYACTCLACREAWMVAQDERIYDNYYLRRLPPAALRDIVEYDLWPDEFLTYEQVLSLGKAAGKFWRYEDPHSPALVTTAEELRRERPSITTQEIAELLAIPEVQAADLLR